MTDKDTWGWNQGTMLEKDVKEREIRIRITVLLRVGVGLADGNI